MEHLINRIQSSQVNELIVALIKAKLEFKPLVFDKKGNRNKYASLGAIKDATEKPLLKNGITLDQYEVKEVGHEVILVSILTHISGQWRASTSPIISDPNSKSIQDTNQRHGAALTYTTRYAARTILGLYADEDDLDNYDHSSSRNNDYNDTPIIDTKPAYKPKESTLTPEQLHYVEHSLKGHPDLAEELLSKLNLKKLSDIPNSLYIKALETIKDNIKAKMEAPRR